MLPSPAIFPVLLTPIKQGCLARPRSALLPPSPCVLSLSPGFQLAPPPTASVSGPTGLFFLLQDHLQQCLFQAVQCSNENCQELVLRKDLKEHLSARCHFREEKCLYCKKDVVVINLQVKQTNKQRIVFMGLNST